MSPKKQAKPKDGEEAHSIVPERKEEAKVKMYPQRKKSSCPKKDRKPTKV